jgi:hypothetical protein
LAILKFKNLLFTVLLFLAIILVRFNGNQLIVKQQPYDSKYFKAYVEYFRGKIPTEAIRPATNWRFLIPLIASQLPFSELTAINILNALFLGLSLLIFFKIQTHLQVPNKTIWANIWLFIVSFPTFYYATIGYVDAALFLFISISIYAALNSNAWLFTLAILVGLCVKETMVIAAPFYLVYHFKTNRKNALVTTFFTAILAIILLLIIKQNAPVTDITTKNNFWKFDWQNAVVNFYRFNTWVSFIASFGTIGLAIILNRKTIFKNLINNDLTLACLACFGVSIILYVLSYFSTIADGRIIWLTYFYMLLPLSASRTTI